MEPMRRPAAVDPAKLRFPLNRMAASDERDWDGIRAWARSLPAELGLVREPVEALR